MKQAFAFADQIRALTASERSGLSLCHAMSALIDDYLLKLWNGALPGVALVAVGGYGRAEMAPFSDIDLMILTGRSPAAEAAEAARALVYRLWDDGFQVGYSVRGFRDCLDVGLADATARTAVLESRFLAGDASVFAGLMKDVYPKLIKSGVRQYVKGLLKDREERHHSHGDAASLLEPQIKEGEGGLRDIHLALWLMRVAFGTDGFRGLDRHLDKKDVIKLFAAYDFIQKIRVRLHLASGRKNDTLDFENQDMMAVDAGFAERFGLSPAERMMRRYYLHAREGTAVSKVLIDTAVRQVFGNIGGPSWFRRETLSPPFRIMKGWLVSENAAAVLDPTHRMIETYAVSARRGAPISAGLKRLIRANLKIASGPLRADRAAAAHFREILSGQRVSRTLREMHADGILGRYMPEFGRLRALVVREPYHRYTVDEHTLNAVEAVEALGDPTSPNSPAHGILRDVFRTVSRRHILYLAVLIHDAGKALRIAGAHEHADVSEILERLRVSGDDRRLVEFLVRNHLLMSVTAQKREIDNPEVVREFAARVEDIERLDYLFLLTYADMSAVRPGFWSGWRQYLVTELYSRTAAHLRGELRGERRTMLLAGVPERGNPSRRKVEDHLNIYSKRYLRETPDDTVPRDVLLLDAARSDGFACRVTKRPAMGGVEITVCAMDRPGLLAGFARILSSAGLDILKAQAYTGSDNTILDRFTISNWDDVYWRGLENRLSDEFRAFIKEDLRRPVTPARKAGKALGIEPSIIVDNELSQRVTAIEIVTPDRIGLLADMFYAIHDAGLDVVSARIQTDGGVATDIIYTRKAGFQPLLSAIAGLREILIRQ